MSVTCVHGTPLGCCGFPACVVVAVDARTKPRVTVEFDPTTLTPASLVLRDVERELTRARRDFAPMHSAHEGHAVIREEFEELWEHVRANTGTTRAARAEAVQLAAMAVRYVLDVCDSAAVPQ